MIVEFPALIVDDLAQGLPATDGPDIAAEDQRPQPAEQQGAGVQRPRPSRSAVWSLILVVALGAAWYLTEQWLPRHGSISPAVEIYILRPLIWAALGGLATIAWLRLPERPTFHWILPVAGLLAGLFHVSTLIIAGFFTGFGSTPSFTSWTDYPLTAISLAAVIIGVETTRAYLAVVWKAASRRTSLVIIAVLVFIAGTPVNLFSGLDDAERLFRVGGGRLMPALVLSGALTWMAARGGPSPAIAYSAVLTAFWWFFLILPDMPWSVELILGGIVPLVSIWIVGSIAADALEAPATPVEEKQTRSRWLEWAVTGVLGLLAIGFFSGTFGVRPFVVSGISMEPTLNSGDVVLVWERTDFADLAVGDVIKVRNGRHAYVHRIVSIGSDEEGPVIVTQGDNVQRLDPPVRPEAVDGEVIVGIPWIGKLALWNQNP